MSSGELLTTAQAAYLWGIGESAWVDCAFDIRRLFVWIRIGRSSVGPVMPGSFPGGGEGGGEGVKAERISVNTLFEVDQSLPTTIVQIRLADGTRYPFILFNFIRLHFIFFVHFFLLIYFLCL
jgi:hypothetical protein